LSGAIILGYHFLSLNKIKFSPPPPAPHLLNSPLSLGNTAKDTNLTSCCDGSD
jgi:hypothetical protein